MSATQYNITLPMGQLSVLDNGVTLAKIHTNIRNRDKTLAAITSLSNLDSYRFWLCNSVSKELDSLNLCFEKPNSEIISLRRLIPKWQTEPALHLSRVLNMAQQLLHMIGELENLQPFHFYLSPGQVFFVKNSDGKEHWITLPLPIDNATIADFLRADQEGWSWLSADEILGIVSEDREYTVGAVLYLCLIGNFFPDELSRVERIRRVLFSSIGNRHFAQNVLRDAVPKALAKTANDLSDFILSLLMPSTERVLSTAQVSRQLDYFCEELSPPQLAYYWEDENNISRARKILEEFVLITPDYEIPWEMLERLRSKDGDKKGAAEAAWRTSHSNALMPRLQELIVAGDSRKQELEEFISTEISKARKTSVSGQLVLSSEVHEQVEKEFLSENDYLYLAYIKGRYLGHSDETLQLLEQNFSISWSKVISSVLKSRILADKSNWIEVTRSCRKGRQLIYKMPDAGGKLGCYAVAYLDLLDGIANICAVSDNNNSLELLNDVLMHLNNAWQNQQTAESNDLNDAIIFWLFRLYYFSENNSKLEMLCLGIEAFMEVIGVDSSRKNYIRKSEIPWFEESRLFF